MLQKTLQGSTVSLKVTQLVQPTNSLYRQTFVKLINFYDVKLFFNFEINKYSGPKLNLCVILYKLV